MHTSNTDHGETLDKIMENYSKLFPIDGKVTDKQYQVINILRQIINEDFVAKERQITNQNLYDLLKEVL
jgi:hypothetical protein